MNSWSLIYENFESSQEKLREALCTLGNGYFCTRGDLLRLNPCLPRDLNRLKMRLHYRGQSLEVEVTARRLSVTCLQCGLEPVKIFFRKEEATIEGGQTLTWDLTQF